jgi:hypothetical protein
MLYVVKNTAKSGSVFVGLRGLQTLKPGQSKTVELNDADRGNADLITLEHNKELSVEEFKGPVPKADSEPATKAELDAELKTRNESRTKTGAESEAEAKTRLLARAKIEARTGLGAEPEGDKRARIEAAGPPGETDEQKKTRVDAEMAKPGPLGYAAETKAKAESHGDEGDKKARPEGEPGFVEGTPSGYSTTGPGYETTNPGQHVPLEGEPGFVEGSHPTGLPGLPHNEG